MNVDNIVSAAFRRRLGFDPLRDAPARKYGQKFRPHEIERIVALRRAGWKFQAIADEVGSFANTIGNVCKREGL